MSKQGQTLVTSAQQIEHCIYVIREHKVMLDKDLAMLYQVHTKRLNEQFQRNIERFPEDFAFQLNSEEWNSLRSQFATSNVGRGGRRYFPYAFTEQGVAMLSSVLNSSQAIAVNIEIMRAFIRKRHVMASQKEMSKELTEVKSFLLKHKNTSDREFRKVWQAIEKLSQPPTREERRIGFNTN